METVDPMYTNEACLPDDTLRDWYANLKERYGVDDATLERNARDGYKEVLRARKGRDMKTWIENWEKGLSNAKLQKVPEALKTTTWFDDLCSAVKDVPWLAQWLSQYEIGNKKEIKNGTLSHRELTRDMLDQVRRQEPKNTRVQKGAFGPTFAGEPAPEEAKEEPSTESSSPHAIRYTRGGYRRGRGRGRGHYSN